LLQKRQVAIQPIPFNGNFWSCVNDETNFNVYESPRLSDKNKHTWYWFAIHYLLCYFLNSPSCFPQSQPLSNHYSKEVTKKKLTYGMVSWVSNYFEILDFKLVWFDTMYKLPCTGTLIYRVNYFACSARCICLSQNTLYWIICTKV